MIQVYTGKGKGKTTAALGLALRAVGHGKSVKMIQFMKGQTEYGEIKTAEQLNGFSIEQYGRSTFVNLKSPAQIDIDMAQKGLERAREIIKSNQFDIVILDEINIAAYYNLVDVQEVISLIKMLPKDKELILTGRNMPAEIEHYADLISDVNEIKHYYKTGTDAREGIEY